MYSKQSIDDSLGQIIDSPRVVVEKNSENWCSVCDEEESIILIDFDAYSDAIPKNKQIYLCKDCFESLKITINKFEV